MTKEAISNIVIPGPVVQISVLLPGLVSIFKSLLIHNDVDSSKLFSLNNLTLAVFKLSGKIRVRARFGQFNFLIFFTEIEKSIFVYFNCLMFILK